MKNQTNTPILRRSVLREEIKSYLIDAIMRGTYAMGERLIETQISKELGVSQAPVREAFRDLEQMGMLESVPYKGAYVKGYSLQDVKNAYEVRAELEGLAIRQAVQRITDDEIDHLESIYNRMLEAASINDLKEQVSLDVEFHELLVKASKNKILEIAWRSISSAHWTYFGMYKFDSWVLVKRHEKLLTAFRKRDTEWALESIRNHFLELKEMLGK